MITQTNGTTPSPKSQLQSPVFPAFATIRDWCRLSGVSRSTTYELLAAGHLQARKVGARTLIDVHHGVAWLDRQPLARIRPHGNAARSQSA